MKWARIVIRRANETYFPNLSLKRRSDFLVFGGHYRFKSEIRTAEGVFEVKEQLNMSSLNDNLS